MVQCNNKIYDDIMNDTRRRQLDEAARLIRKFRKLPAQNQRVQVNRLLAEQRHLDNTVYERRVRQNNKDGTYMILSKTANREYLKTGRGILFPVGIKANGSLIWKTEDVDFLSEWLAHQKTNPWTGQTLGEPTLPQYIVRAIFRKTGRQRVERKNLHTAARSGNVHTLQNLLNHGADVNDVHDDDGSTPLHNARTPAIAEALIHAGANVNATNEFQETPLFTVHESVVPVLLEHGANPNVHNMDGETPLHFHYAHPDAVRALVSRGANPNARDQDGRTPVHFFLNHGVFESRRHSPAESLRYTVERLEVLLRSGGDLNVQDASGQTPVHEMAYNARTPLNKQLFRFVILLGGKTDIRNVHGETPLDIMEGVQQREQHRRYI